MSKEVEFDGKKYEVKIPSPRVVSEATKRYAIEFTKCLQSGILSKAQMKKFLIEHDVISKEKGEEEDKLIEEINRLEKELYRGSGGRKKKVTLKEGRAKALKIKELRGQYLQLSAERQSFEANTAEKLAEDVKFDYMVSESCFDAEGNRVYSSYEDYQANSDSDLAYNLAASFAELIYGMDEDYIKKLPENQFLAQFGLVNDDLRLVDKDGNLVDKDYRRVNEQGFYIDDKGNRVDRDGNPLNQDGNFDISVNYTDDDGKPVKPKSLEDSGDEK